MRNDQSTRFPSKIEVVEYDPEWPRFFSKIRDKIWPAVSAYSVSVEHVGSTSVPGLAAKPVIDIDLIIKDRQAMAKVIEALSILGYEHRGNLGIDEREAFISPSGPIKHHLYACFKDSVALANHLCLRDSLRKDPDLRDKYGKLKLELASRHADSIDSYVEGKTDFILEVLKRELGTDHLKSIRRANQANKK